MFLAPQCNLVHKVFWQLLIWARIGALKNKALRKLVVLGLNFNRMWKFELLHFKPTKPGNYWLVQNGFMEKLICNKNLALSAKSPPFEQSAQRILGDGTGRRAPDIHNSRHFLFLCLTGGGQRTAQIASSKTVLRPRCMSAEHSRHLMAPISLAMASPAGRWWVSASSPSVSQSCLYHPSDQVSSPPGW